MKILNDNIHWLLRISLAGTFIAHGLPKLGGDIGMGFNGYLIGPFEFFGAILILSGVSGFLFNTPFYLIGFIGGIIEILFSFIILSLEKKMKK